MVIAGAGCFLLGLHDCGCCIWVILVVLKWSGFGVAVGGLFV